VNFYGTVGFLKALCFLDFLHSVILLSFPQTWVIASSSHVQNR